MADIDIPQCPNCGAKDWQLAETVEAGANIYLLYEDGWRLEDTPDTDEKFYRCVPCGYDPDGELFARLDALPPAP